MPIVRVSLILLALSTLLLTATPGASAMGCLNVEHDNSASGLIIAQPASDGTGVVVGASGQAVAISVVLENCQIPPQLIQHFMTQTGQETGAPIPLLA